MKKVFIAALAMMVVGLIISMVPISAIAATPGAGIVGTDHDFSSETWTDKDQICVVCHTPHGADTSVTAAPLWNHDVTTKVFTVYSSDTLNATVGQPDGVSKLCLSCHDGTVAEDAYGGRVGSDFMTGDHAVGADELNNDHPVSFTYDTALATADGQLTDPGVDGSGITPMELFGGKLECASCHDPHNVETLDGDFLRETRTQSKICLTCHTKGTLP